MNNKVCFVILHYGNNIDITKNAIKSIETLDFTGTKDIVVVCNGKEYDISKELNQDIHTIVLPENKGFSVGNNTGYFYAKQKDTYDFILILNNDIVIEQKDFLTKLYDLYQKYPFFVAGPDVYTPYKDLHSSPLNDKLITEDADEMIRVKTQQNRNLQKSFSLFCVKDYLLETFPNRQIFSRFSKFYRKLSKRNMNYDHLQENVVLQGSFLIFSKDYIEINDKAFEPEVFLYFEEEYLAIRCRDNNWKMIYFNELQVLHYHRGSANIIGLSYHDYCKKKIFINQQIIDSAEQYKSYLIQRNETKNVGV